MTSDYYIIVYFFTDNDIKLKKEQASCGEVTLKNNRQFILVQLLWHSERLLLIRRERNAAI